MLPITLSSPAPSLGIKGADVPTNMPGSFPEGTQLTTGPPLPQKRPARGGGHPPEDAELKGAPPR